VIRLSFAQRALKDFEEIHDYIARDNVDAALNFIGRLRKRCIELAEFPGIGRRREELRSGYRSLTEGDYVILYRLPRVGIVEIVRVLHAKRDIRKALRE
jgi:toxin ParE1/3/4